MLCTDAVPLAWDLRTQISNIDRICSYGVCDLPRPVHLQWSLHERFNAAADHMKVMSSCRPILVISLGASSSDLERANSSPSTSITCIVARDPCQPPLVVLSTVQPSSHLCQNLVSHGSHCAAQTAASCGHAALAASKHVERKVLPWAFPDQLVAQRQHPSLPWGVAAMSFAQPCVSVSLSTNWCELHVCAATSLRTGVQRHSVLWLRVQPTVTTQCHHLTSSCGPYSQCHRRSNVNFAR